MARKYWIVNLKTKTYIETDTETFDGDWKENYPHCAGNDYIDVYAYSVWEHNMANGLYYVCDLCRDGGMFTLLTDKDKHTPDMIEQAKSEIRHKQDVVTLSVLKLTTAE